LLLDGATGGLARLTRDEYRDWEGWLGRQGTDRGPAGAAPGTLGPPRLSELTDQGFFRTLDYPEGLLPSSGLHSLCLNVSHACELACRYCFAGQGAYGGRERSLMDPGTARRAVDFLLSRCSPRRTLSIDFFGGEPLLAWETVVETVRYGRSLAASCGIGLEFTLTTNGVGVTPERAGFLAREMSTIIVSLDGRPDVHNRMRPAAGGAPSYERALAGAVMLAEACGEYGLAGGRGAGPAATRPGAAATMPAGSGRLWVRGTFTRYNLDFWRDAEHLWNLGFGQVSIEPVTGAADAAWGIREADLPCIRSSYLRLLDVVSSGRRRFYHFELSFDRPACAVKRLTGCGAGISYACVSPSGSIYPCHQFDGMAAFRLGSLDGTPDGPEPAIPDARFARLHVGVKTPCRSCWAQLYCGGGCHYRALEEGGGLANPDPLACRLLRIRLEAALALAALKST